jgi:hypothetical protein
MGYLTAEQALAGKLSVAASGNMLCYAMLCHAVLAEMCQAILCHAVRQAKVLPMPLWQMLCPDMTSRAHNVNAIVRVLPYTMLCHVAPCLDMLSSAVP